MESKNPQVPTEAIELYNDFIHGEISRRAFMDGIQKVAGSSGNQHCDRVAHAELRPRPAGLPNRRPHQGHLRDRTLAARATAASRDILCVPSAPTRAPRLPSKLPGVIVVHENRGLNPHIEDIARRFALANFMAFAPDGLTSLGGYPGDDYKGGQLFNKIDKVKMAEDMIAAAIWLKARPDCTGKIGVTGFCYGGGIANTLAVRLGADLAAAAPFYGGPPAADDIPKIKAAILVHHGELDTRLVATWPGIRQGPDCSKRPARRLHLPELRSRLQLRCDAGTLQQGSRRSGMAAHHRLVQQIRAHLGICFSASPRSTIPQ